MNIIFIIFFFPSDGRSIFKLDLYEKIPAYTYWFVHPGLNRFSVDANLHPFNGIKSVKSLLYFLLLNYATWKQSGLSF